MTGANAGSCRCRQKETSRCKLTCGLLELLRAGKKREGAAALLLQERKNLRLVTATGDQSTNTGRKPFLPGDRVRFAFIELRTLQKEGN